MKSFIKPLPASNNVKGSGTGSPAGDMNKISDALVEIRSSVPNAPNDINAVTSSEIASLSTRISNLVNRISALKSSTITDAFTRTSLGSSYTVSSANSATVNGSALVNNSSANMIIATTPVKSSYMWTKITVVATDSTTEHPSVVINYNEPVQYRAGYSGASGKFELYRASSSGTFWNMVAASAPMAKPSSNYTLTLRNDKGLVTVQVNNSVVVSYTDDAPLTGKRAGIYFPASSMSQRAVDDFSYGN
jgi:hypothetical protein